MVILNMCFLSWLFPRVELRKEQYLGLVPSPPYCIVTAGRPFLVV